MWVSFFLFSPCFLHLPPYYLLFFSPFSCCKPLSGFYVGFHYNLKAQWVNPPVHSSHHSATFLHACSLLNDYSSPTYTVSGEITREQLYSSPHLNHYSEKVVFINIVFTGMATKHRASFWNEYHDEYAVGDRPWLEAEWHLHYTSRFSLATWKFNKALMCLLCNPHDSRQMCCYLACRVDFSCIQH